jgi:hypothetical protein
MKIKTISKNLNVVSNEYVALCFSYETPVAGYNSHIGFFKTKKFWSTTTSKHINKFLAEYNVPNNKVMELDQEEINQFNFDNFNRKIA